MKIINKILFLMLTFVFMIFINNINIYADEIDTYSEKYLLYNLSDNEVIIEKNAHEKSYIASLTKIMTVITAIEKIDNYNQKIEITEDMLKDIAWDVAIAGFKKGDKITYNDLLYASILASGADAVNALAISISGNYEDFVKLMNNKVKELKLKNTNFANITGLFDENNYSSAYDMTQILKYALKNKKFKEIFETHEYTTTNNLKLKSTITRSSSYIGEIKGAKTGYIKAAGNCLATTATINDANLILVTLNAHANNINAPHIKDTIKIYNYIKDNYSYKEIISNEDVITKMKVKYTKEKEIEVHANTTIKKFLQNDFDKNKVKINFNTNEKITFFTKENYNLGKVTLTYNGKILSAFNLLYNEEVSFSLISYIFSKIIYVIIIYLLIKLIKNNNKRKRRNKKINRLKRINNLKNNYF